MHLDLTANISSIALEDFIKLSSYGTTKLRTALVISNPMLMIKNNASHSVLLS